MTNNSVQVFKGGWEELESAVITDNKISLSIAKAFKIKPDGTKLFSIVGNFIEVRNFGIPYDPDTISGIIDTFEITVDADPVGIDFRDDGTRMYVMGDDNNLLYQYDIPIPWDLSSIVSAPVSISLGITIIGNIFELVFGRDGDNFYVTVDNLVYQFPLPTPWDITSNVTNSSFNPGLSTAVGLAFKPQGDKMYIGEITTNTLHEYDLPTINDITTAVATGITLSGPAFGFDSIQFRSNGMQLFEVAFASGDFIRYHLDEDWNISTTSYFSNQMVLAGLNAPTAINWKPDGTKFFILNLQTTLNINEFTALHPWNITNATSGPTFNFTFDNQLRGMWWRQDGTRCYITDADTNKIYQLDVATPWTVSTITDPSISFTPVETTFITGLYMREDGKKYYLTDDSTTNTIYEYDMITAWDITTSSYSGNSINIATTQLTDVFFKRDGKMMYISELEFDKIQRFILSTPWDVSTATLLDFLDVNAQDDQPQGFFIQENNGKKLFMVGSVTDDIFSYDMSLEFNNSLITNFGDELQTNLGEILVHT